MIIKNKFNKAGTLSGNIISDIIDQQRIFNEETMATAWH